MVIDLEQGSPAQRGGLRTGDIIVSVNRIPVSSAEEMAKAARAGGNRLLLNVRRGEAALFILMQ